MSLVNEDCNTGLDFKAEDNVPRPNHALQIAGTSTSENRHETSSMLLPHVENDTSRTTEDGNKLDNSDALNDNPLQCQTLPSNQELMTRCRTSSDKSNFSNRSTILDTLSLTDTSNIDSNNSDAIAYDQKSFEPMSETYDSSGSTSVVGISPVASAGKGMNWASTSKYRYSSDNSLDVQRTLRFSSESSESILAFDSFSDLMRVSDGNPEMTPKIPTNWKRIGRCPSPLVGDSLHPEVRKDLRFSSESSESILAFDSSDSMRVSDGNPEVTPKIPTNWKRIGRCPSPLVGDFLHPEVRKALRFSSESSAESEKLVRARKMLESWFEDSNSLCSTSVRNIYSESENIRQTEISDCNIGFSDQEKFTSNRKRKNSASDTNSEIFGTAITSNIGHDCSDSPIIGQPNFTDSRYRNSDSPDLSDNISFYLKYFKYLEANRKSGPLDIYASDYKQLDLIKVLSHSKEVNEDSKSETERHSFDERFLLSLATYCDEYLSKYERNSILPSTTSVAPDSTNYFGDISSNELVKQKSPDKRHPRRTIPSRNRLTGKSHSEESLSEGKHNPEVDRNVFSSQRLNHALSSPSSADETDEPQIPRSKVEKVKKRSKSNKSKITSSLLEHKSHANTMASNKTEIYESSRISDSDTNKTKTKEFEVLTNPHNLEPSTDAEINMEVDSSEAGDEETHSRTKNSLPRSKDLTTKDMKDLKLCGSETSFMEDEVIPPGKGLTVVEVADRESSASGLCDKVPSDTKELKDSKLSGLMEDNENILSQKSLKETKDTDEQTYLTRESLSGVCGKDQSSITDLIDSKLHGFEVSLGDEVVEDEENVLRSDLRVTKDTGGESSPSDRCDKAQLSNMGQKDSNTHGFESGFIKCDENILPQTSFKVTKDTDGQTYSTRRKSSSSVCGKDQPSIKDLKDSKLQGLERNFGYEVMEDEDLAKKRKSWPLSELDNATWMDRFLKKPCNTMFVNKTVSFKHGNENEIESRGYQSDQENIAPEAALRKRKQDRISGEWEIDTRNGKRQNSSDSPTSSQ